jgi:hypothetical protein
MSVRFSIRLPLVDLRRSVTGFFNMKEFANDSALLQKKTRRADLIFSTGPFIFIRTLVFFNKAGIQALYSLAAVAPDPAAISKWCSRRRCCNV